MVPFPGAPKVSVLMSTYNRGAFLRPAIESVLAQSFADFEFVVRDNDSTDGSDAVVESFRDPRIRFARNGRNLGPVASMNNCIEAARGEYVVFAHGDDIWYPDFLETCVDAMEKHPEVALCHSLMDTVNGEGVTGSAAPRAGEGECRLSEPEETVKRLLKGCFINTPTAFIRRDSMQYLDSRYIYTGDWNLWLRIAVSGRPFLFVERPLMAYRVSPSSETSVGMGNGDMVLESYMTLRNFFRRNPRYAHLRTRSMWRLSQSILRRSRDVGDRETLYCYHVAAMICSPLNMIDPVFLLFFLTGRLFGPKGMGVLKTVSRCGSRLRRLR